MAEIDNNSLLGRSGLPGLLLRGDEDQQGPLSRLQRAREEREETNETTQTRPRTDQVNNLPEGEQGNGIRLAEDVVRREAETSAAAFQNLGPAQPVLQPTQQADVIVGNNRNENEVGLNQFSGNLRSIRGATEGPTQAPVLSESGPRGPVGEIQQTFRPEFGVEALGNEQIGQPNLNQPGEEGFIARIQQAATGQENGPQPIREVDVENPNLVNQAGQGAIGNIQATFRPEFGIDALDEDPDAGQGLIGRIQQTTTEGENRPQPIREVDVENPNLVNQAGQGAIGNIQATFRPEFGIDALDEDPDAEQGLIGRIQQTTTEGENGPQPIREVDVENPNIVNQAGQGVIGNIQATFRPEFGIDALDEDTEEQGVINRIQQNSGEGREIGRDQDVPQPQGDPNILNPRGQGPIDSIQQRAAQPEAEFGQTGDAPTNLLNPGTEGPIGRVEETATQTPTGPQPIVNLGQEDTNLADPTEQGPIGNIQQAQAQQESPFNNQSGQTPSQLSLGGLRPIERVRLENNPEQLEERRQQNLQRDRFVEADESPVEEIQQNLAPAPELEQAQEPQLQNVDIAQNENPGPVGTIQQTAAEDPPEPNIQQLNENPGALRINFLRTERPLRENRELRNVLENQPEPEPETAQAEPETEPEPVPASPIPIQERVATLPEPAPPIVIEETPPVPPPDNQPVEVEVEAEEELTVEQQLALAIEDAEEVPPPPPPDPEAIVTERGLNLNQLI